MAQVLLQEQREHKGAGCIEAKFMEPGTGTRAIVVEVLSVYFHDPSFVIDAHLSLLGSTMTALWETHDSGSH